MRILPSRKVNRVKIPSSHRQWSLKRSHSNSSKGQSVPGGSEAGQVGPRRDRKKR